MGQNQWCGSRSGRIRIQRYKMKEKAEFNQQFLFLFFFSQKIIFFKSEPKKVANLYGLGSDLKIISFFLNFKDVLKSIWWFYWSGSGLDQDPSSSNFVDTDWSKPTWVLPASITMLHVIPASLAFAAETILSEKFQRIKNWINRSYEKNCIKGSNEKTWVYTVYFPNNWYFCPPPFPKWYFFHFFHLLPLIFAFFPQPTNQWLIRLPTRAKWKICEKKCKIILRENCIKMSNEKTE